MDGESLSFTEHGVLQRLRQWAESQLGQPTPPGIWIGSAAEFSRLARRAPSPRRLREIMVRLEERGAVRLWRSPGQRGSYPILLDGHLVSDRQGRRYRTDARTTADWRTPALRPLVLPAPAAVRHQPAALPLQSLPEQVWRLYCRERGQLAPPPDLNDERRERYLRAAIEYPGGPAAFLLDFGGALRLARRSRFLLGANRSGRPFGLDWLLRAPENLRKTLAGRYDDYVQSAEDPAPALQYELPWPESPAVTAPPPSPLLSDHEAAEAEWTRICQSLRAGMNPKSYATWIAPLRAAGYAGETLFVSAPTADFVRVPERFAAEIPADAPPIRVMTPAVDPPAMEAPRR